MSKLEVYNIKKGDTLGSIAKQFQHRKWETIWNAPENKSLASKRKKPELIQSGDQLTIPANEQQQKEAKQKSYTVTIDGKKMALSEKDYDKFSKEMVAMLKQTAVLAAEQRVVMARSYWNSFNELNNDQTIVSWCVGFLGPKLPPEAVVSSAEQALSKLKKVVLSGDFTKIGNELKTSVAPINKAYETMTKYKDAVIGRSGTWLTALEFTSNKSFEVLQEFGTVELGSTPASAAGAGAATAFVKSAATEFGKRLAGTSGGGAAAAKNVVLDSVLGAASGAVKGLMKAKGDEIVKGIAETAAKKFVTGKWVAKVGAAKWEKFIANRLDGAMKGGLESSVKNGVKLVKGDTTPKKFFEEVAKDMGLGSMFVELDQWVEGKFAPAVYEQLLKTNRKVAALPKDRVIAKITEWSKKRGEQGIEKALELAIERAKGHETIEQIGSSAVLEFTDSNLDQLEQEVLEGVQNKP